MRIGLLCATALLFSASLASAQTIGPGNTVITNNDTAFDLIAIDLANPVLLSAGTYTVDTFNFQFSQETATIEGTIQPLLVTGSSPNYTVIALGGTVEYEGDTAFISFPFGGSDSFTLLSADTVYAAFYWDGEGADTSPIGFLNGAGNTDIFYDGADAPTLGAPVTTIGSEGVFARTYDFSVSLAGLSVVPEPSSLVLAGLGAIGLVGTLCRRKRK